MEPKKIKSLTVSIISPSIYHEVMGPDAMVFVFWMLSFKPTFSLSSFTFVKRLFSSSSISAERVVSSAYLRLCSGAKGDLLQEDLCHTLQLSGLLLPKSLSPWQATTYPHNLHRRHSNTQRQVWLSQLCRSLLPALGPGEHRFPLHAPSVSGGDEV